MRFTLTGLILFTCFSLVGQEGFKNGYIVKDKDTIRGFLKEDIEEKLSLQVVFKSKKGDIETLNTSSIHSFGFDGGNKFKVVNYSDPTDGFLVKEHFAKVLFEGTNDLYSFVRKDIYFFVVHVREDTSLLLFDDITSASGHTIDQGNYKNQLFFIGRECEEMRSQAERISYNEDALMKYVVSLEKCIGNASTATVYYVKSKSQVQIFLFGGGLPLGKQYQITAQGIVKFILPSQSRKTSLNSGIVYLRYKSVDSFEDYFGTVKEYDHIVEIIEIPLTIQYNLTESKIQPYAYGGIGLAYKNENEVPGTTVATGLQGNFGFTLIAGAGIEAHVSKTVIIKSDWRYDFIVHYPVIGIGVKIK